MIADDGTTPILMDFGSTVKARINVENRSQALLQQDIAAEQSTMAYRAPELFDVKTGHALDEKVDIWVRPLKLLYDRKLTLHDVPSSHLDVHSTHSPTRTLRSRIPRLQSKAVQ
jgi:hypothetical protein